ncbi:MAG TPA: hypothetical protein VH458_05595 [Vicinamibacterales bacterium]|jgi:hypothetical protein
MAPISMVMLVMTCAIAGPMGQTVTKTGETITATATIQAIDQTARTILLRSDDGTEDTIYVPAAVKRFDEFHVGDKVTARYYESYVFQLRKPGEKSDPVAADAKFTPGKGPNPAGTLGAQIKETVEVVSVDPSVPSITVKRSDGHTVTRKVDDKKHLEGVNPGDRIDITATMAAAVSVEPAGGK